MTKKAEKALEILDDNEMMIESILSNEERKFFKSSSFVSYLKKAVHVYGARTDESTERNI
jgi:hypothetical protein